MESDPRRIKDKLINFYDHTSRDYHRVHYYVPEEYYSPLRVRQLYVEGMIAAGQVRKSATILDVGCGPGELSLSLLKKGYEVWGVDISQGMVDEATRTVQANGLRHLARFSVGDIEDLDFKDGFFDLVVASGVMEYQKDDDRALSEMNRVLRVSGYLILNVTNRYSYTQCLSAPYAWLKRHSASRRALSFLKNNVLQRGILHDLPDHRTHSPFRFDKKLSDFGFRKIRHNYFHFSPLPAPLDSLLPSLCGPVGKCMERKLTNSCWGILGGGYLVMAQKVRT